MAFVPKISWTSFVHRFVGEAFRQRGSNCWSVAFVRNLQFALKMRKWLMRSQPFIDAASVLSIQELMNSMPRRCYDEDGVVHTVLSELEGVLDDYVLTNHFRASGTVFEEDCPTEQVYLVDSIITAGVRRLIPTICQIHSLYDYVLEHGVADGEAKYVRELRNQLKKGAISIVFDVYDSYFTTEEGEFYDPSDAELEEACHGRHCVLATALGTFDDVVALECQDSRGPTWGSSGYIYVAMAMVPVFFVIR